MKKTVLLLITVLGLQLCHAQATVTTVEYFIDADNGVGLNTLVAINEGDDITAAILATIPSSISIGHHKLYLRTKDSDNRWSQTLRNSIEVIPTQIQNNIVTGEYFLNVDPFYASGTKFQINPQNTDINQAFLVQIAQNATLGFHKVYGRVKDTHGNWSLTFRKNIQVVENSNKTIVAIEYFFGDDLEFGNNTAVTVETPEADGTWFFNVPYPAGPYSFDDVLFVRVKNSNQIWSQTAILDEIDPNLSVHQIIGNNFLKVYPNPVKHVLNITSSLNFDIQNISLHDITGRNIFSTTDNKRTLNLSYLNTGMYTLVLTTTIGNASYKIIKQ
jgi:hypothetical protein